MDSSIIIIMVILSTLYIFIVGLFEDLLSLLHQNVCTLNSALIFTLVLKTSINFSLKQSSVIFGTYSCSLSSTFLLYMVFLVMKMIYPAMNLALWLVPAGILIFICYYHL